MRESFDANAMAIRGLRLAVDDSHVLCCVLLAGDGNGNGSGNGSGIGSAADCLHVRLDPVASQLRTMFAALLWALVFKLCTLALGFLGRFLLWLVDCCRAVRHARTVQHVRQYIGTLEAQWYAPSPSPSSPLLPQPHWPLRSLLVSGNMSPTRLALCSHTHEL